MRTGRLLGAIFSMSLQRELAYRTDLVVRVVLTVLTAGGTVGTLAAVYARVDALAGWRFEDALVLVGIFVCVNGVLQAFVEPNLEWFQGKVRSGALDDVLLRPVASVFLVSFGTCRPWALVDLPLGAGIVAFGASAASRAGIAASAAFVGAGCVIAWAMRLVLASAAFWAGGLELTVLYYAPWQLGRYPVDVYGRRLRWLLTYVVPVAFVSTFPARALTRGAPASTLLSGMAVAFGAALLALRVWRSGLHRYTSATS